MVDPHLLAGRHRARRYRNRSPTASRASCRKRRRLDFLRSYSRPGESLLFFTMKDRRAAEGCARDVVPGAQEGRRHRGDAAARRAGSVLQRRVRRRLHEHLRARRRRLFAGATARLRRSAARGAAARAGRRARSTTSATRKSTSTSRSRTRSSRASDISPQQIAQAVNGAERRRARRHAEHARRPRVRAPERPVRPTSTRSPTR